MKPLHIGLLIAAGAIGGAVLTKVTQSPAPAPPAVTAQAPAPAPVTPATPVTPAETPADTSASLPSSNPSPFPEKPAKQRKTVTPAHRPVSKPPARPEPVVTAQSYPPATPAPVQQQPQSAPPPVVTPKEPEPVAPPPPPPPPPPQKVTLKAGTLVQVRVIDGLSTERSMPGDHFSGTIDQPLVVDGFVIAERGARVEGRVVSSDKGGKVKGVSSLAVELTKLHTSDGQTVAISTDSFEKHGETSHKEDAAKIGAGAAIGAVIGAIAGGGKGAAIGAGVGGGAGAGDVLLTRGKAATIPSETRISFRLREPVTITERQR
jgi:hypothetical protein